MRIPKDTKCKKNCIDFATILWDGMLRMGKWTDDDKNKINNFLADLKWPKNSSLTVLFIRKVMDDQK